MIDKFIVRACNNLMNSYYADGREAHYECAESSKDEKCYNITDCYLKQIAENLLKVVRENTCSRCDGCGYDEGCADSACGTHAAHRSLDLLDIEFVGEEK